MLTKKSIIKPISSNARSHRIVQNFQLVWLDESIDEVNDDDYHNSITELRHVINTVNTFVDVDECIDFITDIQEEQILFIVSTTLQERMVPILQEIDQVKAVYIFSRTKISCGQLTNPWYKVKGIFTDITSICTALKRTVQDNDHNLISISCIKIDELTTKNLDTLDCSFMYTQILKEILLTIDFEQVHIKQFITYCREQFTDNVIELENIDKIAKEYRDHQPIWWYTSNWFLYSMLNRALRLMEIDFVVKLGFFVKDLHQNIATLHTEQYNKYYGSDSFTVYRGQGLLERDFDQLKNTQGGLLSFNNFLSTSLDRAVSFAFAESVQYNPNMLGILFIITIDPSISPCPFAKITNVSYYKEEEEILFSTHSSFRIGEVKQINENNRLWQVNLTLTSDNDPQLHAITKFIREETYPNMKGWLRLANLLIQLGQFDKAQQTCDIMLEQTTNDREEASIYHMLGMVNNGQGRFTDVIKDFEKSIKIVQKLLSPTHSDLAASYTGLGLVYNNIGENSKALSSHEKALEILEKNCPANHLYLTTCYNNISLLYDRMGQYSKAILYYQKALEIREKTLPPNHPSLATSYNNIGVVYDNRGEYSKALSCFKRALEIRQKILPENHPLLATSYNNIAGVYNTMGEYSKALSYYEKTVEIDQKTLPVNHPDLAISYNNIGMAYYNMKEYSKALSYLEKALPVFEKTLPVNHPFLGASYNNIGGIYHTIGKYSEAVLYQEKSLKIYQKTLPTNHPNLAICYSNIGCLYVTMRTYSKALSYFENALTILQSSLPSGHPHIETVKSNIEIIKKKL